MIVNGTDITMTRGDTVSITVSLRDLQDPESIIDVPLVEGDTVYFTVKKSPYTEDKILQKVVTEFADGEAIIPIAHADTKDLAVKSYYYDVQVTFADGTVTTVIKPSRFRIAEEVTYE